MTEQDRFADIHHCTLYAFQHSGVKTKIDRLLLELSKNAWAVQMTRDHFSEHDVANALKRSLQIFDVKFYFS